MKVLCFMLHHRLSTALLIFSADSAALAQTRQAEPSPLPAALQSALRRERCRVPTPPPYQPDSAAAISFVAYRAAVLSTARKDWVVICQRSATRLIYVYRTPVLSGDAPFAKLKLSGWSPGPHREEDCDALIRIAPSPWIMRLWQGAARAARLTAAERARPVHAGIEDGTCEGTRFIWYWTGRSWIRISD